MSGSFHVNLNFSGPVVLEKKIFKWPHPIFVIISPLKRTWPFIWTNLNSPYSRMISIKFDWNWPAGSGEDFKKISVYFYYFAIISPCRRVLPFIWTNLNPLPPRMICGKFGWNWPSSSGEEVENVKSLQRDGQTDGRRTTGDQKSSLELSAQVS